MNVIVNVPEKFTPKTFITNHNCKVEIDVPGILNCTTTGRLVTIILFCVGLLLIYGSIFVIGWDLPQGRIHSSSIISGALIFVVGIFFQWRCLRRKKEMGVYKIDSEMRRVSKYGVDSGYSFDYISRMRITIDWTAIQPLNKIPHVPYWLFIHFKNGHQIRIASGRRNEIMQVLKWLRDADVPAVEWV